VPLVFNMHFTGTMDHWDPLVTDGSRRRGGDPVQQRGHFLQLGRGAYAFEEMGANASPSSGRCG